MYSHEILAESGDFIPGNLRNWFVLPYMDEPDKDHEFAVYFTTRWADQLKITLHNFLSVVLSTAPAPKILLLERWFRSEAQQEIRTQLKLSAKKIDSLVIQLEKNEIRLASLRETMKELITHLHKATIGATSGSNKGAVGLFETDDEAESKRKVAKELAVTVTKLSSECVKKSRMLDSLPREIRLKEILGKDASTLFFKHYAVIDDDIDKESSAYLNQPIHYYANTADSDAIDSTLNLNDTDLEEVEGMLIKNLQQWLKVLSV